METYNDILQSIEDHERLNSSIREMADKEQSLNLVRADWEKFLLNHLMYKEYLARCSSKFTERRKNAHSAVQNIRGGESTFNVTTLGRFRIAKNMNSNNGGTSLVGISATDPIDKILSVMTADVEPSVERNTSHRFFFEKCNFMICKYCKDALLKMTEKGIKVPSLQNQNCITKSKVYDGQHVKNTFRSLIECGGGDLLAAVTVNINCRYFFKQSDGPATVKIGGTVKNIIFFKDSALKPTETVYLGDLNDMCVEAQQQTFSKMAVEAGATESYSFQPSTEAPQPYMTEEAFLNSLGLSEPREETPVKKRKTLDEEYNDVNDDDEETAVLEAIPTSYKKLRTKDDDDEYAVTVGRFNIQQ